ncbi:MAG: RsmE family RNA methyltransferase [Leptonema sp. (in: bacteria)]
MLILFRENIENRISLSREEINHIKALRLQSGDWVLVSQGNGIGYYGKIIKENKILIDYEIPPLIKNFQNISIASAIPSGNRFDKMIEMSTQLGIGNFYPLIFERSERKDFSLERTKKIIKQACSQSKNLKLPTIHSSYKFTDFINKISKNYIIFYADTTKNGLTITEIINFIKNKSLKNILVIVGPEGGFSPKEKEFLSQNYKCLYLNDNILRIETAVLSVLSIFAFLEKNI